MRYPDLVPFTECPTQTTTERLREQIQRDVEAYLARGGTIKQCSTEDNKGWKFDPHRPAVTVRDEVKRMTWDANVRRRG
jgi:hypothetical protein